VASRRERGRRARRRTGEPGIGKTTVWQAAIEQAWQSGRIVLACRGSGAEVGDAKGRGALLYARALVTGHLGRRCGEFHSSATRNASPGPAASVSHLASSDSTVVDLPTRPVRRQHFRSVHRFCGFREKNERRVRRGRGGVLVLGGFGRHLRGNLDSR
jgi:hypothetical protein